MTSRVTDLDRVIATNLKRLRETAKLTQPQVADHLSIAYQSYQKMEAGRHSFRVFTLDRLGVLYNKRLQDFLIGGEGITPPAIIKAQMLMLGMSDEDRETCIRAILKVKHAPETPK